MYKITGTKPRGLTEIGQSINCMRMLSRSRWKPCAGICVDGDGGQECPQGRKQRWGWDPGDLPNTGIEPTWQANSLPLNH